MYDQQREAYVQSVLSQLAQVKQQQQQAKQEATSDGEYMRWSQSSHATLYGALIHSVNGKIMKCCMIQIFFFMTLNRRQKRWEIMRKEIVLKVGSSKDSSARG